MFLGGDPLPWFTGVQFDGQAFSFQKCGGRCNVLFFLGSFQDIKGKKLLEHINQSEFWKKPEINPILVSSDRQDGLWLKTLDLGNHITLIEDIDTAISAKFGAVENDNIPLSRQRLQYKRYCLVTDTLLRALNVVSLADPLSCIAAVEALLKPILVDSKSQALITTAAPILQLSRVLESRLCQQLKNAHLLQEKNTQQALSSFRLKSSEYSIREYPVRDEHLREQIKKLLVKRIFPEMVKCFHFKPTHLEYLTTEKLETTEQAPRANISTLTAHRQFSLLVNIAEDEQQSQSVVFPEFGQHSYVLAPGGALVYSSGLLYTPIVAQGSSMLVFKLFMFDEVGAKTKQRYLHGRVSDLV